MDKKYVAPKAEFVVFEANDIITESYVCPDEYGNTCTGNPYVD